MSFVVLTDFDGTLVTIDTAEFLLDKFADKNWRLIDEQLERGEVTFEESLQKEFAMLRIPENAMVEALQPVTCSRPNVQGFLEYCQQEGVLVVVVSGGLDFCIKHFLKREGWLRFVEIYGPKANCTKDGVMLTFPELYDKASDNFKEDLVRHYQRKGQKVVYIGNGLGDYPAAKVSEIAFAIKDSRLAELCKNGGVAFEEITDFQEVVNSLRDPHLSKE